MTCHSQPKLKRKKSTQISRVNIFPHNHKNIFPKHISDDTAHKESSNSR